jgi:hypothetical protein
LFAAILSLLFVLRAPAVTVTGFSPASGQPGNLITVTGSGFNSATSVGFNNANPVLAGFKVQSDSQLTAVVPLGATTGPITVNSVASSASFTVAPTISGFSPTSGGAASQVYIIGNNFISGQTTVTFSGVATPVTGMVTALTVVGAVVPAGAVTGPLTVTTPAGSATSTSNFLASSTPIITSFDPVVGLAGTNVTIVGGNFFGTPTVKFGGPSGVTANATVVSTTELIATIPVGATTGQIYVSTSYGSVQSGSNFMTGAAPIITSFAPVVASVGMTITNFGYNLSTVTNVTIHGAKERVSGYGSGYLEVGITNPSGTGLITVTSPSGSFTTTSNFSSASGPVISGFSPAVGGPGIYVVISGVGFTGASSVKFFNGVAASFHVSADTQIIATVPSASTGPVSVTVGSTTYSTTTNFTVTSSAPLISGFSPSNGVPGTTVTINGINFTNVASVSFNGVPATFTPPTSTTVLYATVPSAATSGLISVTTSGGTASSATLFYGQPWITNTTGSNIVNGTLVINGSNLTNASAVVVGGVNYTNFTNSPTQIVAVVPSNAVTGTVSVTAPGGVFISTNSFVVLPKIYSFTPTIGPAGTVVTIGGTSLFDVTSVLFNGVSTTPFNVGTNQLQATVPAGARPGPITVVTPGGNDVSTNIFTATYASSVDLTKTVSPEIAGPGTNVTYTMIVSNAGPSDVTAVTLTDVMPSGFNFASATTTQGTTSFTNGTLTASLGILLTNARATITVSGTSSSAAILTNLAALSFPEGNTIYGTNSAAAAVYFVTAAQRTLSITNSTNAGSYLVTWPVSGAPFTVQVSTNLALSNGWQNVTNAPFVTNGLNTYTNPIPAPPAEFFRLQGH